MSEMGRPTIEYDKSQVELFGRFKATYETMADWYDCSVRTIERLMSPSNEEITDFCRAYKKGQANLKLKVSEAQIKTALEGNPTLLIWLGKQYLGQVDKQEIDQNVTAQVTNTELDLSKLPKEDIEQIHSLLKKAKPDE